MARFLRYMVGSLTATVVSATVLTTLTWRHTVPPAVGTVLAFIAGALVNFAVFRFWTWRHTMIRQARAIGRDFAKFSMIAVATAAIASGTTTLAGRYADHAGLDPFDRTLLIDGAYFGAFAVMFFAKFLILDRFVFGERSRRPADVAGDQVETTTPA